MTPAERRRQLALSARSLIGHTRRDLRHWQVLQRTWLPLQASLRLNLDPLVRTMLQLQAATLADERARLIRRYEPDSTFYALARLAGDARAAADHDNWQMHDRLALALYNRLVEVTQNSTELDGVVSPSPRLVAAYLACAALAEDLSPQLLRLGVMLPEGWKAVIAEAKQHPQYPGAKP